MLKHLDHLRFIIVSTPRSATRYISEIFMHMSIECGYENVFTCERRRIKKHMVGDASWQAAPFLPMLPNNVCILHQIRDPLKCISSMYSHTKLFSDNQSIFYKFARKYSKCLDESIDILSLVSRFWLCWHNACLDKDIQCMIRNYGYGD